MNTDSAGRGKFLAGRALLAIISMLAVAAGAQELPKPRDPPLRMTEPAKSGMKRPAPPPSEAKKPVKRKVRPARPSTGAAESR